MKYTPGLLAGQLSGKAGNTVASRNKGGSYFRTRVIPKLVRNIATTNVRANFTALSQLYRELTESQRQGWTALGANTSRKNSLGEAIHLTGLQMFQSVNRNNHTLGGSPVLDAPANQGPSGLSNVGLVLVAGAPIATTVVAGATSATQHLTSTTGMFVGMTLDDTTQGFSAKVNTVVDATHVILDRIVTTVTGDDITGTTVSTVTFSFTPGAVPVDTFLSISFTPPLSAGVSRPPKSAFRFFDTKSPGDTSPVDYSTLYTLTYGNIPIGAKVFVNVRFIGLEGLAGSELQNFALAT